MYSIIKLDTIFNLVFLIILYFKELFIKLNLSKKKILIPKLVSESFYALYSPKLPHSIQKQCFPAATCSFLPSGRIMSALVFAGITNSYENFPPSQCQPLSISPTGEWYTAFA